MSFWKNRGECPYQLKETCKLIHSELEKRMNRQDALLIAILGGVLTTLTAIFLKG